jgi:hypothetical protein
MPIIVGGLLVLFGVTLMTGTVVRTAFHRRLMKPQHFSASAADTWILEQNEGRKGYFVDIGATGAKLHESNTRLLEAHGWTGLCADPVPRDFEKRVCGVVPRPIGARTGDRVNVSDCGAAGRNFGHENMSCTEAQVTTLGIDTLLTMAEAPQVIDYISISARGSGLPVLKGFPWQQFCARAWTVELSHQAGEKAELRKLFAEHNCRIAEGLMDFWAECPCSPAEGQSSKPQD